MISAEHYLSTSYRPDCDYIDGDVLERNLGEREHSNLQGAIDTWFRLRRKEWNIWVFPEHRVQVSATRFRIPDICIVSREWPWEPIVTRPPIVCIEILSKDDTLRGMQQRVTDYFKFGVPNVWIIDPETQRAYVCSVHGFVEPPSGILEAPGTEIRLPLAELSAYLD